jgi:glutamate racemase
MVTNNPNAPIGVFDSGLGGLTVLKSCLEAMPNERFVYLGDTARTPYGSKAHETIRRYGLDCAHFLAGHDVKMIVVACNTVSAHALADIEAEFDCPVIGTVDPAISTALNVTKNHRYGVIGTEATVAGGVYQRGLKTADPAAQVFAKACPLFVPLVEQGMVSGSIVDQVVELYMAELRAAEVDAIILGCTHYPLLAGALGSYLSGDVSLVACSDAVAAAAVHELRLGLLGHSEVEQTVEYFVTDAADKFDGLAATLLGIKGIHANHVDL